MNVAYQPKPTNEKIFEMKNYISGYWQNDIWNLKDDIFSEYRKSSSRVDIKYKRIRFDYFTSSLRVELKYFLKYRIENRHVKLDTILKYAQAFSKLASFLNSFHPSINSFSELDFKKTSIQLSTFLINHGIKFTKFHGHLINQIIPFYKKLYDTRNEFDKDTWDVRNIENTNFSYSRSHYLLHFEEIPLQYRELVKRYIKLRLLRCSYGQCYRDIKSTRSFLQFLNQRYRNWNNLNLLSRKDMEDYFIYLRTNVNNSKKLEFEYLLSLKVFLEFIQKAEYAQAPLKPIVSLFFKEDIPKLPRRSEENIKYIPENVLLQLDQNLEYFRPKEYIPIVVLLRATGWRISDILNLRYDNCLDKTPQGWYLCGDIQKTNVLNHRVPITDEVAAIVKAVIEETIKKDVYNNNPKKLLFVRTEGKRQGWPPEARAASKYLNRLAKERNIVDDQGNIFHFKNHAFRHTKAVELINNGMNLLHVQRWLAHSSPEMSLHYARILDETMRKSWEEATKEGLFRIDESGKPKRIDISDIENEDIIEWEYIRHNLDAVRMPLGYCMKPKKQECHTQLNPCLTCRNLCTTPDFISQYELEIQETKAVIERGKSQNRNVWVEKNQALLERYEAILTVLKDGKTHHRAGKKGREYVGEERNNG